MTSITYYDRPTAAATMRHMISNLRSPNYFFVRLALANIGIMLGSDDAETYESGRLALDALDGKYRDNGTPAKELIRRMRARLYLYVHPHDRLSLREEEVQAA